MSFVCNLAYGRFEHFIFYIIVNLLTKTNRYCIIICWLAFLFIFTSNSHFIIPFWLSSHIRLLFCMFYLLFYFLCAFFPIFFFSYSSSSSFLSWIPFPFELVCTRFVYFPQPPSFGLIISFCDFFLLYCVSCELWVACFPFKNLMSCWLLEWYGIRQPGREE